MNNFWLGIVEDRDDPQKLGRVRVRIFGAHSEKYSNVPVSSLPFATVLTGTDAAISGIGKSGGGYVQGTMVCGFFMDGESAQMPVILGSIPGIPVSKNSFNAKTVSEYAVATTIGGNYSTSSVAEVEQTVVVDVSDTHAKLKAALGKRESNNNYGAVNQFNYIGKYQMGAAMLSDLGYVNRGTKNRDLNDPTVWTGKNGITSKEQFLASPQVQETVMDEELALNTKRLEKIGVIDSTTTDQERAGFLATSHLLGTGGAKKMKNGVSTKDGNGVSGEKYYVLGYESVAGEVPNVQPSAVVPENPARKASVFSSNGVVSQRGPEIAGSGFGDPDGVFPRYINEQDTNRLSRNQNIDKTIVALKEGSMDNGVRIAHGGTWNQSPNPYNAKYPFNQVHESESGHVFEIDDTPNNERIAEYHKSGTFSEIDRNGTLVRKIVGDNYEIIERNGHVHVKGTVNITVEGNANLLVGNDCNLQVDGKLDGRVSGDIDLSSGGDVKIRAKNNLHLAAGRMYALDALEYFVDIGASRAIGLTLNTSEANGVPSFPALILEERSFEALSAIENDDATDDEISEHRQLLMSTGVLDENPIEAKYGDTVSVAQNFTGETVVECGMFISGQINMADFVSANYKLSDLSKTKIVSQDGLTDAQIACNLKALATNVLEPIKTLYPDVIVTSGFRVSNGGNSQHHRGMAIDLVFPSANMYEVAQKLSTIIPFDQLILEYDTDRRRNDVPVTWIHISFNSSGNRKQIFTMNKNKRITDFGVLKEVK